MKRGVILPERRPLVMPDTSPRPGAHLARAIAPDRPGRVTLTIGDRAVMADMAEAASLSSHVVDGTDVVVLAFFSPLGLVGLYQPLDVDDARGLANAIIIACGEIEEKAAQAEGASQ